MTRVQRTHTHTKHTACERCRPVLSPSLFDRKSPLRRGRKGAGLRRQWRKGCRGRLCVDIRFSRLLPFILRRLLMWYVEGFVGILKRSQDQFHSAVFVFPCVRFAHTLRPGSLFQHVFHHHPALGTWSVDSFKVRAGGGGGAGKCLKGKRKKGKKKEPAPSASSLFSPLTPSEKTFTVSFFSLLPPFLSPPSSLFIFSPRCWLPGS